MSQEACFSRSADTFDNDSDRVHCCLSLRKSYYCMTEEKVAALKIKKRNRYVVSEDPL